MTQTADRAPAERVAALEEYYSSHANMYDATRSYLLGRRYIVSYLGRRARLGKVLEVGCGTGTNLRWLAQDNPGARLIGIDLSEAMLEQARHKLSAWSRRVDLRCVRYAEGETNGAPFDAILFSYSLSMMNPHHEHVLDQAVKDLAPGGVLAVVDYDWTPMAWYQRFMSSKQVEMRRHLLPALRSRVVTEHAEVHRALLGAWEYFTFVGRKPLD